MRRNSTLAAKTRVVFALLLTLAACRLVAGTLGTAWADGGGGGVVRRHRSQLQRHEALWRAPDTSQRRREQRRLDGDSPRVPLDAAPLQTIDGANGDDVTATTGRRGGDPGATGTGADDAKDAFHSSHAADSASGGDTNRKQGGRADATDEFTPEVFQITLWACVVMAVFLALGVLSMLTLGKTSTRDSMLFGGAETAGKKHH